MLSADQVERAQTLREMGFSVHAVAQRLGVDSREVYRALGGFAEPKPKMQRRLCLCCGTEFASEGAHNRLCPRCRKQAHTPCMPLVR